MQTAQIKAGTVYAYKRNDEWVRFFANAIITRKTAGETKSVIEGYIVEDHKDGVAPATLKVEPGKLDGEYGQRMELVERQKQEAADKKARDIAKAERAHEDRLALYAFVGEEPPEDATAYHQPFRVSYGTLDFSNEGEKLIVAMVRALQAANVSTAGIKKIAVV